jgi:hypothetical protein
VFSCAAFEKSSYISMKYVLNLDIRNLFSTPKTCSRRIRKTRFDHFIAVAFVGALSLVFANCGGNGSSSTSPTPPTPPPSITSIYPSSAPEGGQPFTLSVTGSNFISGSKVLWDGSERDTNFVNTTQLTAAITATDISNAGTVEVRVINPTPESATSNGLTFTVSFVPPLSVMTTSLPYAQHKKDYNYALIADGGIPPYTWSLVWGLLPSGLSLSDGGIISGTPPEVGENSTISFIVEVGDSAYQPNTSSQPLDIILRAENLGRNDTCNSATPITNGMIRASLSPYGDIDVYSFHGTAGNAITIETFAQRITLYGDPTSRDIYLDSFLEILDSECVQLSYNDDISLGTLQDSLISDYELPYSGNYFIRVSDLRGDGRPDFIYDLQLSGAD